MSVACLELHRARLELECHHTDDEIVEIWHRLSAPMFSRQGDLLAHNTPSIASNTLRERGVIVGPESRL